MIDWQAWNAKVDSLLRLNSSVVAVKFIGKDEEAPAGLTEPPKPITICQFVTLARVHGEKLFATPDNVLCGIAQGVLGLDALPNVAPRYAGGRVANEQAYNNILRDMPKVPNGKYRALAITALVRGELRAGPSAVRDGPRSDDEAPARGDVSHWRKGAYRDVGRSRHMR